MKRKLLAGLLSTAMMVSCLAGCGGGQTAQTAAPEENKTESTASAEAGTEDAAAQEGASVLEGAHTVKIVLPGEAPKDEETVLAALHEAMLEDGLDITVDTTYFSWDDYSTKINLIGASGEKYDLCWTHSSWIAPMVSKKVLQKVDDLLPVYGKDLLASMNEAKWIDATIGDGIYGISTNKPTAEYNRLVMIRKDLREKYGIDEIKTLEDLDNFFLTVHENQPDTIMRNINKIGVLRDHNYAAPYGDEGRNPCYIDIDEDKLTVRNYYESEAFKDLVNINRKWYNDGIMVGPDKVTVYGQYLDAGLGLNGQGEVGVKLEQETDAFKQNVEGGELEEILLNPEKPVYIYEAVSNMISLFSTSDEPEAAIAFINWVRSNQENYDLFSYGIEGVHYNIKDNRISYEGIPEEKRYSPLVWVWEDMNFKRFPEGTTDEYINTLKTWDDGAELAPTLGFKFDTEPVITQITQIDALAKEYAEPALFGFLDYEDFIDEFLTKLEAAGINDVIAEMQSQLDEFLANK